jgi:hypothetical protein
MDLQSISEGIKATGMVHIVKTNEHGVITDERNVKNLVVTTGKNYIASKMVATTNSPVSMTHMGIGTGNATPAIGDTALGAQTTRQALTGSAVASNSITYTATFAAGQGDGAIQEAGIFNASTAGTMLCRTTFPVVNKGSGDTITITWVVTVS